MARSRTKASGSTLVRVGPDHASAVAELGKTMRAGLQDVIDLTVLHNEKAVHGAHDRRLVLNRLIAFQSVAVWERLAREVTRLVVTDASTREMKEWESGISYLGGRSDSMSKLTRVLDAATAGVLPGAWRIWVPASGSGKKLTFGRAPVGGHDAELAATVDWWIAVRNGVAHRNSPLVNTWSIRSDAKAGQEYDDTGEIIDPGGHTINTTTARFALALFLQLIDQTMGVLLAGAQVDAEISSRLKLPAEWFAGRERAERRRPDEATDVLRLWSGRSVAAVGMHTC